MFILEVNIPLPTLPTLPTVSSGSNGTGNGSSPTSTTSGFDQFMGRAHSSPYCFAPAIGYAGNVYGHASAINAFGNRVQTFRLVRDAYTAERTAFIARWSGHVNPVSGAVPTIAPSVFNTPPQWAALSPQAVSQLQAEHTALTASYNSLDAQRTIRNASGLWEHRGLTTPARCGLIAGVGRILSIFGAFLAVHEAISDSDAISTIQFENRNLGSSLNSGLLSAEVSAAIEAGDTVGAAGALRRRGATLPENQRISDSDIQSLVSSITAGRARVEAAESNSKASLWGFLGGCALGVSMLLTGPVGWFATGATICSGIGIGNLVSKLFRRDVPPLRPESNTALA